MNATRSRGVADRRIDAGLLLAAEQAIDAGAGILLRARSQRHDQLRQRQSGLAAGRVHATLTFSNLRWDVMEAM